MKEGLVRRGNGVWVWMFWRVIVDVGKGVGREGWKWY